MAYRGPSSSVPVAALKNIHRAILNEGSVLDFSRVWWNQDMESSLIVIRWLSMQSDTQFWDETPVRALKNKGGTDAQADFPLLAQNLIFLIANTLAEKEVKRRPSTKPSVSSLKL